MSSIHATEDEIRYRQQMEIQPITPKDIAWRLLVTIALLFSFARCSQASNQTETQKIMSSQPSSLQVKTQNFPESSR